MNVTHMSRFDMKRMLKNDQVPEDTLIISINDTSREAFEMEDYSYLWNNIWIYPLVFKDDNESFSEEQAESIKGVVESSPSDYKNIIVHCFAGISRSAAVAKWINTYFNLDIPLYNNYTQHNLHVYNTLCKVSGVETLKQYYEFLEVGDEETNSK